MSKRTHRAPTSRRDRKGAQAASRKPRAPQGDEASRAPANVGSDDHVQQALDEALAESFPASDPVAIVTDHKRD